MQFTEALTYIQNNITSFTSDEVDPVMIRAMFEDILIERASEYFEDMGDEVTFDNSDWNKMEELLQSKIPDYSQFVQSAADAFLEEYKADIE